MASGVVSTSEEATTVDPKSRFSTMSFVGNDEVATTSMVLVPVGAAKGPLGIPHAVAVYVPLKALVVANCWTRFWRKRTIRSEEHTSELQSHSDLVCRLLLEKKN